MSSLEQQKHDVLSFDVGIRHLAFCHLRCSLPWCASKCQIMAWDVIDLGTVGNLETCATALMRQLYERFASSEKVKVKFDTILIERQPRARSIIMVAVQMFLCAFFSQPQFENFGRVRFISAAWKLNLSLQQQPPPALLEAGKLGKPRKTPKTQKRAKYQANKKTAITTARHYLEHVLEDFANLALLDIAPKKDDLSDAFLQAIAFVEGSEHSRTSFAVFKRRVKKKRTPPVAAEDVVKKTKRPPVKKLMISDDTPQA